MLACSDPEADIVWSDEHLDLGDLDDEMAADLGRLTVLIDRAVRRIPGVERCHVNKWGDGGAHLHVAFLGRPSGMMQLRGSNLALWEDMLPPVPADVAASTMRQVADELAHVRGRAHT